MHTIYIKSSCGTNICLYVSSLPPRKIVISKLGDSTVYIKIEDIEVKRILTPFLKFLTLNIKFLNSSIPKIKEEMVVLMRDIFTIQTAQQSQASAVTYKYYRKAYQEIR
jgi:hypothetical protein